MWVRGACVHLSAQVTKVFRAPGALAPGKPGRLDPGVPSRRSAVSLVRRQPEPPVSGKSPGGGSKPGAGGLSPPVGLCSWFVPCS